MRTPFLGPAYVSRSSNLADCRLINLYPELVETDKAGEAKAIGGFYMTPGMVLKVTCGNGPVLGAAQMGGLLYVVSGDEVYSVTSSFVATLIGAIGTAAGPVSMITNGNQLAIFDGVNGYLLPGGAPLTGGVIAGAGSDYIVGDVIYLLPSDGTGSATASVNVTAVNGTGGVTTFTVAAGGAFSALPTGFTQQTTSGAGAGFTLTTPTFGASAPVYTIPLPFAGPVSASYQEGFGLINQAGTNVFWQTNLFDLSVVEPLNFSSADGLPDHIVGIGEIHLEQWLFKNASVEIWINAGLPNFAFQRLVGVFIEIGCAAAFSIAKAGEHLLWLTGDEEGNGQVMISDGYVPKRVSTHALEREIATYPSISDAIGFSYQQEGHLYYVLIFPSGNATWVYDVSESASAGMPLWHQRAAFDNGAFSRHWMNCYAFFAGSHLVGDYRNGNVYAFSLDVMTDNGARRKWVRSWRANAKPVDHPMRYDILTIDLMTGIGVPAGTDPQCILRWSDDGGHLWSNDKFAALGKTGQTARRVMFKRMGSTRMATGLDRTFELSSTDPYKVGLIGARINDDIQL